MAVSVYDRNGAKWDYLRAATALADPDSGLVILDGSGNTVGGFNPSSWTHWADGIETDAQ